MKNKRIKALVFVLILILSAVIVLGCKNQNALLDINPVICEFIDSEQLMKIHYSQGTLNSIAFTDDYIIAYINGSNLLRIYNKTTKELANEIVIDLGHANCISLGNKYDESDLLPLLYVEVEDSVGTYNVVRVLSNGTASIIKKYTFPASVFGYLPQVTWNFKDGICYSIGYDSESVSSSESCIFVRANLNDSLLNEDTSYTPKELFTKRIQKMMYMQDSKYYSGKIYLAHSSSMNSSAVSLVYVIDSSTGKITSIVFAPFDGEIEGVALYEENKTVKMCVTNYYEFHEMVLYNKMNNVCLYVNSCILYTNPQTFPNLL